jgi:crossover junction endodeoxyribonuclease RuvC
MTDLHRRRHRALSPGIPFVNMQIGATDRRTKNTNQDVELAHRRNRHFLQPKPRTTLSFHQRLHRPHRMKYLLRSGTIVCRKFFASWPGGVRPSCIRGTPVYSVQVRLLALDPALRNCGYAILEKEGSKVRAIHYGVIRNKVQLSMPGCLVEIHRQIEELIRLHAPEECAVEGLIYVQNTRTAITLGAARGSALLAAAQHGLPIYEYPPRRVKQAVVGRGAAQKAQIAFMVRTLLGLVETPDADAADALAIGLTHFQMHSSPLATLRGNRPL